MPTMSDIKRDIEELTKEYINKYESDIEKDVREQGEEFREKLKKRIKKNAEEALKDFEKKPKNEQLIKKLIESEGLSVEEIKSQIQKHMEETVFSLISEKMQEMNQGS